MNFIHDTGLEDAQEIADAITQVQTEYDQNIERTDEQVQEVDAVQQRILQLGASRDTVQELENMAPANESYLGRYGIAIESFTSFPSRTNKQIALEMSDEIKHGLIGAAAFAGLLIVGKIIHMIWKFFRKRGSADERQKQEEERLEKAKGEIKEFLELPSDVREELLRKAAEDAGFKDAEEWHKAQPSDEKYTELLHRVFTESGEARNSLLDAFKSTANYKTSLISIKNVLLKLPGASADSMAFEKLKEWVNDQVDPLLKADSVKRITEFGDKHKDLLANYREYAKTSHPLDKKTLLDLYSVILNKKYEDTMKQIEHEGKFNEHARDFDQVEQETKKNEERFKEWASALGKGEVQGEQKGDENIETTKDERTQVKEKMSQLNDLYKSAATTFLGLLAVYIMTQQQYILFIAAFSTEWAVTKGAVHRILKKGKNDRWKAALILMEKFNVSGDEVNAAKKRK